MLQVSSLKQALRRPGRHVLAGAPEGLDALAIADLARLAAPSTHIHMARDDQRLNRLAEALEFFAPDIEVLRFPAWDTVPYDRVSPAAAIVAQRLSTLSRLAEAHAPDRPRIVLATVNAALQRVPPREAIKAASFQAKPGQAVSTEQLQAYLLENGYSRTGTVVDPGDFAVRGGLVDIFPPGAPAPLRLDFFGDTLESIRTFDPETQRSTGQLHGLRLDPANEVLLTAETIGRFRTGYAAAFGGGLNDPLYEAVSAGRRHPGMEHWLPLFYARLETIFDHAGESVVTLDHLADEAVASRHEQIGEYFEARRKAIGQESFGAPPYKPLQASALYLTSEEWAGALEERTVLALTPFEMPDSAAQHVLSIGGRQGRSFAADRSEAGRNVYEAVRQHVEELRSAGKRVVLAAWSEGSAERLEGILRDHEVRPLAAAKSWAEIMGRHQTIVSLTVLRLETGFETSDLAVIAEQDILGDRLVRPARKARKASDLIAELSSLTPGDLVVHIDHGIGRFEGISDFVFLRSNRVWISFVAC